MGNGNDSTQDQPGDGLKDIWTLAILLAPIGVIWFARWLFREIIEIQKIDFQFFSAGQPPLLPPSPYIPAQVMLSMYYFGFALCATMVLSVALLIYAATLIKKSLPHLNKIVFLVIIGVVFGVAFYLAAFEFGTLAISKRGVPAPVAQALIDQTLDLLPSCDDKGKPACPAPDASIGNIGNSLQEVVSIGFGMLCVAGVFYVASIAAVCFGKFEQKERKADLYNLTICAAITFIVSIVAAHFLFQPGADMITAAFKDAVKDGALWKAGSAALESYENLRQAMTFYWGVIFSMALLSAFFPASIYVDLRSNKEIDFGGMWAFAKQIFATLSPLIAGGVLQLAQEFVDALSKWGGS